MHTGKGLAFQWACAGGHIEVAKWLLTQGASMHAREDRAFLYACSKGHLRLAKWLVSLEGVRIHARQDQAFSLACHKRHVAVGRWLIGLEPEFPWDETAVKELQIWSRARHAWMAAIVCLVGMTCRARI